MPDKTTHHLHDEIKRLKAGASATRILQEKKDRLQEEHKNSQLLFKTIFEQSSLGNKFINANLEIIKVNKALVRLLGYSKKELIGSCIIDIVHPDFVDSWKKLQYELWENKKASFSIDAYLLKKNKTYTWCHITSILIVDKGETLGYAILEDISERKNLEKKVKDASDRELLFQQMLLDATIKAQDDERARIADDLHNSLGQLLFGVKLSLDRIKLETLNDHPENVLAIKNAKDVLSHCIKESRRISHDLVPNTLEDFGLQTALADFCKQVSETINFNCQIAGLYDRLPKYLEKAIYRIVQELVFNVIKHADATRASARLKIITNRITILVRDNGKGLENHDMQNKGIGIRSIRNKILLLKGKFKVTSAPAKGTLISIQIPIKSTLVE